MVKYKILLRLQKNISIRKKLFHALPGDVPPSLNPATN